MGSVVVAIGDALTDQAEQMPLSKHDDVIEQFAGVACLSTAAYPFSHGERGAIRNWRMPRLFTPA
jgi:hypothetical protein